MSSTRRRRITNRTTCRLCTDCCDAQNLEVIHSVCTGLSEPAHINYYARAYNRFDGQFSGLPGITGGVQRHRKKYLEIIGTYFSFFTNDVAQSTVTSYAGGSRDWLLMFLSRLSASGSRCGSVTSRRRSGPDSASPFALPLPAEMTSSSSHEADAAAAAAGCRARYESKQS